MTRWARGGPSTKNQPEESTSWSDMKEGLKEDSTVEKNNKVNNQKSKKKTKKCKTEKHKRCLENTADEIRKAERAKRDAACVIENLPEDESKKVPSLISHLENVIPSSTKSKTKSSKNIFTTLTKELSKLKSEAGELSEKDKQEIEDVIKKDQKREMRRLERIQARDSGKICYQCRETGHTASDCPQTKTDNSMGSGICFKCGSTEHSMQKCRLSLPQGIYPYAKCFICGETGHLSNKCPDNPRGLYPNGGCCKSCGSVEHFYKDCPDNLEKEAIELIKLPLLTNSRSADEEPSFFQNTGQQTKKKVPKVVKF